MYMYMCKMKINTSDSKEQRTDVSLLKETSTITTTATTAVMVIVQVVFLLCPEHGSCCGSVTA
jgi:hypothetical protein